MPVSTPLKTNILEATGVSSTGDGLPACYRGPYGVDVPSKNVDQFLVRELSLGKLEVLKHLWYAGAIRSAKPLHEQLLIGRQVVITERMDLHLLWTNDKKLFVKPLPCFLLEPGFWKAYLCCQPGCECVPPARESQNSNKNVDSAKGWGFQQDLVDSNNDSSKEEVPALVECSKRKLWKSAMGFLYSYICLISYERDFNIDSDMGLLPRRLIESPSSWEGWKKLASEVLSRDDRKLIHPRFLRAELRLARLDTLHRWTQMPPFEPYLRHYWNYGSLFRENITFLATATVFIALVLTAMQVGLATEQLRQSKNFMAASYGFTVFAILGPLCAFGLMIIEALWHFLKDLPKLLRTSGKRRMTVASGTGEMPV
ncbi:hypothetical protein BDW75DRAFT_250359 [Aspergillus navahoensis]